MEVNLNHLTFILHLLILKTSCQVSFPPGSNKFYVTEIVRVKRQAGYVYNKPSIPFELPSQPMNVPTQAPNVDRTQAQQMYYAYPVPASGQAVNGGYSSSSMQSSSTGSGSRAGGYNYAMQGGLTGGAQISSNGLSQNTNVGIQTSVDSTGYSYGGLAITSNTGQLVNPVSTQARDTSSDSGSYRYETPSSVQEANQADTQLGFMDNVVNSLSQPSTSTSNSPGYDYNMPVLIEDQTDTKSEISSSSFHTLASGYSGRPANSPEASTGSNSSPTATSSVSSSYRYDTPSQETLSSTTGTTITSSSQYDRNSESLAYDNRVPSQSHINTGQTSLSSTGSGFSQTLSGIASSGNRYNVPSISNTVQNSKNPTQALSSTGSTATSSVSTSYRYDSPTNSLSNDDSKLTVSTNAPGYLPPVTEASVGNVEFSSSAMQSSDLYKPPSKSDLNNYSLEKPSQSYIPASISKPGVPNKVKPSQTYVPSLSSGPSGSSVSHVSPTYISPPGNVPSAPEVTQPLQSYIPPKVSQPSSIQAVKPSISYVPSSNAERAVPHTANITPSGTGSTGLLYKEPSQSYVPSLSSNSPGASVKFSSSSSSLSQDNESPDKNINYLSPTDFSISSTSGLAGRIHSPTANYLSPSGLSNNQRTSSTPSATYLPPVF